MTERHLADLPLARLRHHLPTGLLLEWHDGRGLYQAAYNERGQVESVCQWTGQRWVLRGRGQRPWRRAQEALIVYRFTGTLPPGFQFAFPTPGQPWVSPILQ
jgi:hypothetical protein